MKDINNLRDSILREISIAGLEKDAALAALSLAVGIYIVKNFSDKEWISVSDMVNKMINIGAKYKIAIMMKAFEK